ncbi:MAG TPA: hypothetical protein VIC59_04080 [Gemmatimonadota bacterium]|jgi:hypothetical protein
MRLAYASLALLASAGLALPCVASAQALRYGGDEGRSDRYRLTNTVQIHQEFQGAAADLTVRSRGVVDLVLERADADTLTYTVVFDSLDLAFEGAPAEAPDLSCVVGRTLRLSLSPSGRVQAFDKPADLCETAPGFDLERTVSHFFPRLPEGGGKSGGAWADTLAYAVSQQGIESEVHVITTYAPKENREGSAGRLVEVAYETLTTVSGEGEQGGTPLILEGSGRGSGTILFAADGAAFWSSTGTQTLDITVNVTPTGQPPLSIPIHQEITAEVEHL